MGAIAPVLARAIGFSSGATAALAFLLGGALASAAAALRFHMPLLRASRVALRIESGDLSRTLPVGGPPALDAIVRVLNGLLADFQEVLLLFACLLRSANASAAVLCGRARPETCENSIHGLASSIQHDLQQMLGVIQGFRYFRVRVEAGSITDGGVSPAAARAGTHSEPTPITAWSDKTSPAGGPEGESYYD